jgi:predicted nucleic acid-binding protein
MGLMRLLTTASVMNQKPLTSAAAWSVYDRLFADDRVQFLSEPPGIDEVFRSLASSNTASPKVWADAYLAAFAHQFDGAVITFDKRLAARASSALLLD